MMCRDNIWRYGLNLDDFLYITGTARTVCMINQELIEDPELDNKIR